MQKSLFQKLISEFIGSYFLVLTIVGSGIMGQNLSNGNLALTLLANALATGAILYVLISMFINISGAYFNPVVLLSDLIQKKIELKIVLLFILTHIIGAILGCFTANWYFEYPIYELSTNNRFGIYTFFSEIVATFGLILTIILVGKQNKQNLPIAVALFITAGYWFTSSTSFANPAVTIGRMFTNTFTGIDPGSILLFILAQIIGSIIATYLGKILIK